MFYLSETLRAYGTPDFETIFKRELARHAAQLPLQQALVQSSAVVDAPLTVIVHKVTETNGEIFVRAGIFFQGVMAGCSCADDPAPASENNEYCVVELVLDRATAAAKVFLLDQE